MIYLPTDKFIKLSSPLSGELDNSGQVAVGNLLRAVASLDVSAMFNSIGTDWKVTGTADYVGLMPKRIAKYLYLTHHYRMTDIERERLGQVCKMHVGDSYDTYVSFTREFDWEDGDFGDEGSCMWDDDQSQLRLMEYFGFYAMKRYSDGIKKYLNASHPDIYLNHSGSGRAWVVLGTGANGIPKDSAIVFNGYSNAPDTCGDASLDFARYLADYLNLYYKKVRFTINDSRKTVVWINSGSFGALGGEAFPKGYLIANVDVLQSVTDDEIVNFRSDK